MAQLKLITAEELLALGKDCHCELVKGVLAPMSPGGADHGLVAGLFAVIVGGYARTHRPGLTFAAETGFRLSRDPDTVRAPDFAFIRRGRVTPEMNRSGYLDLAPDLVVEVVSPGDTSAEIERKVLEYFEFGVSLIWIAYPAQRTVAIHRPNGSAETLRAGDTLSGEDVLPGFTCRVADLFPEELEDQA